MSINALVYSMLMVGIIPTKSIIQIQYNFYEIQKIFFTTQKNKINFEIKLS